MSTDPRGKWTHASDAQADSLCQGRFLAQVDVPEAPSEGGIDRFKGDRIHQALAGELKGPPSNSLSLEEYDLFEKCRAMEKKLVINYFGENAQCKVIRHQRYWVSFTDPTNGDILKHSGEFDVLWRSGTKALIIDYKTGHNEVPESPRNLQLRDYAVLTKGNVMLLDEIATAVIQPALNDEPSICVYDLPALERAQVEMFTRIIASHVDDAKRTPGDTQCQWCKAKRLCSTYQKWAGQVAPPGVMLALDVPMAQWSVETRTAAANALYACQKFLDDIKDFLKEGLKVDPNFCGGQWTLKPGNWIETITDPQACFDRAAKRGVRLEQFMKECVSIKKTGLREIVAAATNLKGKALDEAIKEITEGIVARNQNQPSLARAKGEERNL